METEEDGAPPAKRRKGTEHAQNATQPGSPGAGGEEGAKKRTKKKKSKDLGKELEIKAGGQSSK